jgi:VWFA-related protein
MRHVLLLLLAALVANPQPPGQTTFSSSTQLVIRTVSVKDKNGNPIGGLTAKDFILTEDGKPQTISICEYEELQESATPVAPAAIAPVASPTVPAGAVSTPPITSSPGALAPPDPAVYRDRRLLVLYFDLTAMPVSDQIRAFAAARHFVETNMTARDMLEILTFSGGAVRVEREFTGDRAALLQTLRDLLAGQSQGITGSQNDASAIDYGTAFGQDDSEFNVFNTDRQLAALQTAANLLGQLHEKKALLYFASGIRLNGLSNQAQLQAVINSAIRSGVSLWPVDARGLVAQAPLGDATTGSPGGAGMYSGTSEQAFASNFDLSQDTLWALAADTGGKALLNFNDLSRGIIQAQHSIASYYILGYYTTNQTLDGHYRRIKISLASGLSANLDYSPGYYAGKEFGKFNATDKERQLEDALMLPNPITDLTIALEINYFQLNHAEYFVPLAVRIPGRELALARRRGAEHTVIDFIGEIKDQFGSTITNLRDKVDIKLSGQTAADLMKRPVDYDAGFTLLPGKYVIKFLARDDETGRIGTYMSHFVVPNLDKEIQRLPISSVVLASQIVDRSAALYNSKKGAGDAANPLVDGAQKLIPSVTRVFHKDRPVYVYLQAYEHGVDTAQPLAAYVTLYRGQAKVFETHVLPVSNITNARSKALPVRFDVALNDLPAGKYDFQVTVLNPASQKAAFWQAPVLLVP